MNTIDWKKDKYISAIAEAIEKNSISLVAGGYMDEFEEVSAKMFGNKYGVSTCNGTSSLFLSLFCAKLGSEKKEVILPAYGFHALISVVCSSGLIPVFCDVDKDTFTMDFSKCKNLISKDTLAVIVLHPWGNLANLDELKEISENNNDVCFISDSSHSHEALWKNKPFGKYFDINCASFGLGKLISGGELGILTTDNPVFRDRALLFSHTNRVPWDYLTENYKNIDNIIGIKFRPHLFALLLALRDIHSNKENREKIRKNVENFQKELMSITDKVRFQESYKEAARVFYMPLLRFKSSWRLEPLFEKLKTNNIAYDKHKFDVILPRNTITTNFYNLKIKGNFPNSERITQEQIIHIHSSEFLDKRKIEILKDIVLDFIKKNDGK